MEFNYTALPGRVRFSRGRAAALIQEFVEELGIRSALVIAGGSEATIASALTSGITDRIVGTFDDVRPHVPIAVADAARVRAAEAGADALISIGGGSTTGTAKIVALTSGLPIIAVPTTYAGSEMTPVWGLTSDGRKETGVDRRVLPVAVVYDSALLASLPRDLAVASGFNALAHCVEAFWGPGANPVTGLHAAAGIRALAEGLRGMRDQSPTEEDQDRLLYGSYLAGAAFAVAGSGLHHKICHALGGAYDLPHAQTHAVVLPHVLAFNAPMLGADAAAIAAALGTPDAVSGLTQLAADLSVPPDLAALGFPVSRLDEAVDIIAEKLPISNPRPVSRADIHHILAGAAGVS